MPLNLEPRTGDFIPYLKYNGKSGRWYTRNEVGEEVEVMDMTAIFDLAQIKTGWILFNEGAAPETLWDNGAMAQQPSPKHKRGFAVTVFSPAKIGGLKEYSSCSNASIVSIKELHTIWEAAPEAKQGLVPVVKCEGVQSIKSKFGTNYQPVLKIVKWVDRPEGLPGAAAPVKPLQQQLVLPPVNQAVPAAQRQQGIDMGRFADSEDQEEF